MMNKRIKKQWTTELRSEWIQGEGQLMDGDDRACCLGVLCDIAIREGIIKPWKYDANDGNWKVDGSYVDLPIAVMKWARLESSDPVINGINLSKHNDGYTAEEIISPKSFEEIANLIDDNL